MAWFVRILIALVCLSSLSNGLHVNWTPANSYSVQHDGRTLFSATDVAAFLQGEWAAASRGTLRLVSRDSITGSHPVLGKYTGHTLRWAAGATPYVTTSKNFADNITVVFEQSWPDGANGTSLVAHNASGVKSNQEVISNFPAFTNSSLAESISWAGSFVGSQRSSGVRGPTGATGGPTVFFQASDPLLSTVVVLSPLDNFKAFSAGPGYNWDKSAPAFAPGLSGTVTAVPAGFTCSYVMRVGAGITSTIGEYGQLMQAYHKTSRIADVTLTKVGYQTDNGAYYVFCRSVAPYADCSELLIDEIKQLGADGVPMGYLSFQGSGASAMSSELSVGNEVAGAPWCVNEWGPDLNGTQRAHSQFPMDEAAFHGALGIPLQLYAPYFCPASKYFQRNNPAAQWVGLTSDTTLPGCSGYGFQDATADESRAFYDWFFEKGVAVGMTSFEPDFMNQNYNWCPYDIAPEGLSRAAQDVLRMCPLCSVPEFIESVSSSDRWQHGMTDAALAKNVTVQWCYAAPTDVLNSLTMPSLTNFRVSRDFCYGRSWDIGTSSLIVWAVGAAPSKDTLWTSDNGRFAVPGCQWSPDHEAPAAALHVVLALMSTGPVGISDKVGGTNVTLIKQAITADGTLLKPSKPISSVDSALAASSRAPPGQVMHTYTGESLSTSTSWIFVSFKMTADWVLGGGDFYPAVAGNLPLVTRSFGMAECTNGAAASSCVTAVDRTPVTAVDMTPVRLLIPVSDHTNITGGTDFAPHVATVWQGCTSGAFFLGDLSKYVAASSTRFTAVECTKTGVKFGVTGSAGEVVDVTAIVFNKVAVKRITIPSSGHMNAEFE